MRDNELSMDPLFLYQENGRVIRDFEDFNKKIKFLLEQLNKYQ
jgi:hypothetical protein